MGWSLYMIVILAFLGPLVALATVFWIVFFVRKMLPESVLKNEVINAWINVGAILIVVSTVLFALFVR